MKKVLLLATAALFVAGVTFAQDGAQKKKCAKGKSFCHKGGKACTKDKSKEAAM